MEDDREASAEKPELSPREPGVEDLVDLCRALNEQQAQYVVVGGFAMRASGYLRRTMDIDLIIHSPRRGYFGG